MSTQKGPLYKMVADLVFKKTGIHYPESNYYQLDARLNELAKFLGLNTLDEVYLQLSKSCPKEIEDYIIDLATNNETSFFRDATPFSALEEICKTWLTQPGPFRIWSAGSSTGQEIYSILMTMKEKTPGVFLKNPQFLASDISQRVLDRARSGIYTQLEVQRGLPILLLTKYFTQTADKRFQVREDLRNLIQFRTLNLLTDPFSVGLFDLIFCRNVLIYQTIENKKMILQKFMNALKPGGMLILGSSENLFNLNDEFERHRIGNCSVYRKPTPQQAKAG